MNHLRILPLAIASIFCTSGAIAADYNPSWYIGAGLHAAETDETFGAGNRGYGASLRVGKPLNEMWDVQLGASYTRASNGDRRYQQNTLGADLLYLFSRNTVRPYLVMGVAAERDRTNNRFIQADSTSPSVSAGLGVQLVLNDQWTALAEWRKVHGYLHGNDFGFSQASNSQLSVGLNYSFDKPAAPVRVASYTAPAPYEAAPAVVQAPPPAPVPPPAPRYEKITLSATELFAFNSAQLSTPQEKLDNIAIALNSNMQVNQIVITGYADRIGSNQYNQKLSEKRAVSVKDYLLGKGVASERMSANGKGESNPVVECSNKKRVDLIACLEPNRRVEIEQFSFDQRTK